jgi:hypothetical protein
VIEGRLGLTLRRIDKQKFSSLLARPGIPESIRLRDPVWGYVGDVNLVTEIAAEKLFRALIVLSRALCSAKGRMDNQNQRRQQDEVQGSA